MNLCVFSGNLVRTPEVKEVNGTLVANFSLGVNERYKSKDTGEQVEKATFPNFELWGNGAKVLGDLKQGARLNVTGKYVTRDWVDKEENKRVNHSFRVDQFEVANYGPNGKKTASNAESDDAEENTVNEDKPAAKRGRKPKAEKGSTVLAGSEEENFGF